ncbi:MAG: hypothetical protein E7037_05730 [Verrucomicrobia bacterium]|nr:hypothetical protein [Verrucomicrobiota bacterium]
MDGKNEDNENFSGELDLSALSSLSLEPSWASGNKTDKISVGRISRDDRRGPAPRRERGSGAGFRDRRPPRNRERGIAPEAESGAHSDGASPRRERRGKPPHRRDGKRAGFVPAPRVVEVSFFPEEKPFGILSKAIKNSARTYALFEIANLILEKPERFTIAIKPLARKGNAGVPAEPAPQLVVSVPDGMPFLNEADAFAYVFAQHKDKFFTVETVEIEAPKGNFSMIAKCGFTGELLAPPNYHAYQQILRDHHAANFPKMPFEKFMSRLETVKDSESINAWVEKMKTVERYTIKDRREGEPETLDGVGAAKAFLLSNRKNKVLRTVGAARIPGKMLEQMPMGVVKAGIEHELEFQRKFPLNTANLLRGRLRRSGFSLFKRGAKGITLVCAIRRKFRTPDSVFSDTIQRVFDFLEKHPNTKVQDLPKLMLGIGEDAAKPEDGKTDVAPEGVPAPAENAETASVPAPTETPATAPETEAQLSELLVNVRWLVLEGYVSELSDGSLFTYPKMTLAQAKAAAKEEESEVKAEELAVPAEEAVAPAEEPVVPAGETVAPAEEPAVPSEETPGEVAAD